MDLRNRKSEFLSLTKHYSDVDSVKDKPLDKNLEGLRNRFQKPKHKSSNPRTESKKPSDVVVNSIAKDFIKTAYSLVAKELFGKALNLFDPRAQTGNTPHPSDNFLSKQQVLQLHYSGVTWWLNKKLMQVNTIQIKMEQVRISNVSSSSSRNRSEYPNIQQKEYLDSSNDYNSTLVNSLPESEQLKLAQENKTLMSQFEKTTDHVMSTQKALLEISTLQSQMSQHLAKQLVQTEQLYNESLVSLQNIDQGNSSLQAAKKNMGNPRRWTLIIIIVLSFVLLLLDWF
ncbi:Syntaxin ufe1 [Smittium mucronatum]|uniref:Syntaxin ufe1 n=1 Tax=Smittium mucronatum TaxID=133383 RepID=A0A1R0H6M6_9FUNG|nr:Syntaxin ufe1 [Smittium mucronatum]